MLSKFSIGRYMKHSLENEQHGTALDAERKGEMEAMPQLKMCTQTFFKEFHCKIISQALV